MTSSLSSRRAFVAMLACLPVAARAVAAPPVRDIREFGGKSDPARDQQAALQSALDWCSQAKGVLRLEKGGTYCHSGMLALDGGAIEGSGATLKALDPNNGRLRVTGSGARISDLTLASPATKRIQAYSGFGLLVQSAHGFTLSNVTVRGAATAGIALDDAHGGTLRHILVRDTMADGLHITNGSSDIAVSGYQAINTGDDGFAVVSYDRPNQKGRRCSNIRASGLTITDGHARGVAVVGGADVTVSDVRVVRSACAGLYLNSERSYGTFGNARITARRVQLVDCVTRKGINQGAVHIQGRPDCSVQRAGADAIACSTQGVTVSELEIDGLGPGARAGVVAAGSVRDVRVSGRRGGGKWSRPAAVVDPGVRDPGAVSLKVS
ncbi:right-handed parallel beta-helix repeat-containing protein [Novosphingobium sp. BL-8A]|uniref:right-handed parallel beta-helix repeat-containing protein n=1 Tax=Novosphingobium sp. BL-8A TaxID=3127639 RepID=UPI0037576272